MPADEPPPAPSSRSSSTDDFCYLFVVELERGPSGLGMGLIDGLVSAPPCWLPPLWSPRAGRGGACGGGDQAAGARGGA